MYFLGNETPGTASRIYIIICAEITAVKHPARAGYEVIIYSRFPGD